MKFTITTDDLADGLHRDDHGYALMADVWFGGMQQVDSNGWI
jgi:hypothetical protein